MSAAFEANESEQAMTETAASIKYKGARFVRFYPSDWRSGCIGLTVEQEGLYWRICAHYYETGRRLPIDDKEAAHRLMMNPKNYRRVRDELIALEKIRRHEDGYGNDRAERELEKAVGEPSQKSDQVLATDVVATRGPSDCERQDRGNQGEGRQGSESIPQVDRETIPDQSAINRESIDDQSGIFAEKSTQIQWPSLEPIANSQEPKKVPPTPKGASKSECLEAFEAYNAVALRCGLAQAAKFTPDRERKIRARLNDYGISGWSKALANIEKSAFLTGKNDKGWRASLEFMTQAESFSKLHDGVYGNGRHAGAQTTKTPAYLSRY